MYVYCTTDHVYWKLIQFLSLHVDGICLNSFRLRVWKFRTEIGNGLIIVVTLTYDSTCCVATHLDDLLPTILLSACAQHLCVLNTSGRTPQVASSAAHMYVCSSKLRDVVRVRVFGIDSSNSLPDHAMFGRLEGGSWFMWKIHQFTLAKHTLASRSLQNHIHARR